MTWTLRLFSILFMGFVAQLANAEDLVIGFFCCNVFSDGKRIYDMNINGDDQHRVPVGMPVRVTSFSKHRMKIVVENKAQVFVNDYSRSLAMPDLAKRYIVADDPTLKLKTFSKSVQNAIAAGHLLRGMTREQTLMSLGYPVSSDVPNLNSDAWTYWLTDHVQYRVKFDANDRIVDIENVIDARSAVLVE